MDALEIRLISPELESALQVFFNHLGDPVHNQFFTPHPFTPEKATQLAFYQGQDMYYAMLLGQQMIGYGMLRGWDEGFAIPSLGIALHESARGKGLSTLFMLFLHQVARLRLAEKIRLKVHPQNVAALALYQRLGYIFDGQDKGEQIGFLRL